MNAAILKGYKKIKQFKTELSKSIDNKVYNNTTKPKVSETEGKPWIGNFIGPGPDKDPNKLPDPHDSKKFLKPTNETDGAAQKHDYGYWEKNATGVQGALINLNVTNVDSKLVQNCEIVMQNHVQGKTDEYTNKPISYKTFIEAQAIVTAFSFITGYKIEANSLIKTFTDQLK